MKEYTNLDYLEDFLIENLPHGGGIDYKWGIKFFKNGKIRCNNVFNHTNKNGDVILPFSITIFKDGWKNFDFTLRFHGLSSHWYRVVRRGLRQYLKATFFFSLAIVKDEIENYFNRRSVK